MIRLHVLDTETDTLAFLSAEIFDARHVVVGDVHTLSCQCNLRTKNADQDELLMHAGVSRGGRERKSAVRKGDRIELEYLRV